MTYFPFNANMLSAFCDRKKWKTSYKNYRNHVMVSSKEVESTYIDNSPHLSSHLFRASESVLAI